MLSLSLPPLSCRYISIIIVVVVDVVVVVIIIVVYGRVVVVVVVALVVVVVVTDLHIYNLDAVLPIHVVSNHVDSDKLTTANGGTFTSSSASRSSQSR